MPQRHLELPGVQGVVPPEIPEPPLPGHPERPLIHGLAPHPDTRRGQAGVTEHGHAVGTHPVAASVMLLGLLPEPLAEHLLNLLLGQARVDGRLDGVVIGQRLRLIQPVQKLLGDLLLKGHVLEILQKGPVKPVKIRLALHQQRPAQGVKAHKAGSVEIFVQPLHQGHPLSQGDLQAPPAQQIQKFLKHGFTARTGAWSRCPRSFSAAPPDKGPPSRCAWGHSPRGPGPGPSPESHWWRAFS